MTIADAAFHLLVVGDEILSGKRQDRHIPRVIELLRARGLALAGVQLVGDDASDIAAAIARIAAQDQVLFSCGGIGATPDDLTRQAAAQAYGVPLQRHVAAERLIVDEYGERAWPNRVLMADFPAGARLIPNPVNRVAGFAIGRSYFVPGFPDMAWPMLEWVLDGELAALHCATPPVEYRLRVLGHAAEGDLLDLMEAVLARWPGLRLSSLPFRGDAQRPRHIEFGLKGAPEAAAAAFIWFRAALREREPGPVEDLDAPPV